MVAAGDARDFRRELEQKKGQLRQVEQFLDVAENRLTALQESQIDLEQAQSVILEVARLTQEELKYHIGELVSLALAAVFDEPYEFEIDFQQRRNQTEADLWFKRGTERIHPLSASGGGAVDVAAFALRVAGWSLGNPRSNPILILDEPFSRLKGEEANIRAIQMVKEVSKRLQLQILMVSDERVPLKEIEAGADKVFTLGIKGGISNVRN